MPLSRERTARLFVLSGPSGVGKDALLAALRPWEQAPQVAVTATTRPQRPGEVEGVHYYFLGGAEFQRRRSQGELLEWAQVYGNFYGVPRDPVAQALARGRDVIIKADVQGAATIKGLAPAAIGIFLAPTSLVELEERLRQRRSEAPFDLELRLETARQEMERLSEFDYVVVNPQGRLGAALAQVKAIITAERCRVRPQEVRL
ncbi:MAG: guanylate kinase [Chloroflexi bacterium]|nr:guanylate kinase [Chloroflexota bacterium]